MVYNPVASLSFRQFLELVKYDPGYIDALGPLGIKPDDAVMAPQYIGNATIGGRTYTGVSFQVQKLLKDGRGNTTGAVIKMGEAQPEGVSKSDKKGRYVDLPNYQPGQTITVDVKTLNNLLYPPALAQNPTPTAAPPGAPQ